MTSKLTQYATSRRSYWESGLLATLLVLSYFLARAGFHCGTSPILPLPLFHYQAFEMTKESAVAWDNMITILMGGFMLVAYAGDLINRKIIVLEYETQYAPFGIKNRAFRAFHALTGLPLLIGSCLWAEVDIPNPASNALSLLKDGLFYRVIFLVCLYYFIRFTPYVLVREWRRLTGKLAAI